MLSQLLSLRPSQQQSLLRQMLSQRPSQQQSLQLSQLLTLSLRSALAVRVRVTTRLRLRRACHVLVLHVRAPHARVETEMLPVAKRAHAQAVHVRATTRSLTSRVLVVQADAQSAESVQSVQLTTHHAMLKVKKPKHAAVVHVRAVHAQVVHAQAAVHVRTQA